MLFSGLFLISLLSLARAGEICCNDIGCFTDDPPFDHYRLPRCPDELPTSFELFTRNNRDNGEEFARNTIPSNYGFHKQTILLIHGYMNDRNSEYLFLLKEELLNVNDVNVIIIGWGGIYDYPVAASSTRTVGSETAFMADNLVANGAEYKDMWCIGFSLGAHTCGHAGMRSKGSFGRITGLDPAGPWFENYDHNTGLNPGAADFVDVIHTMTHNPVVNWGILRPVGHIDFYPNGGDWLQPGCLTYYKKDNVFPPTLEEMENITTTENFMGFDTACSHGRSVDYFLESISNNCFVARQSCSENTANIPNECQDCNGGGPCAYMGYHAKDIEPNGIYYLQTDWKQPFCLN